MKHALTFLSAATLLAGTASAQNLVEDFEGGTNTHGWQVDDDATAPLVAGGNPGTCIETLTDTSQLFFAAMLWPSAPVHPWSGNFRGQGVTEFHYDREVVQGGSNWGTFPHLLLGNDNGTADWADDTWVYVSTGDVFQFGAMPWTTFHVPVPAGDMALPATWGYQALPNSPWAGLGPDATWNNVITDVSYVAITSDQPWGLTWFGNHTVRYDNLTLVRTGGGTPLGTTYCTGNPNSTGLPGELVVTGSQLVNDNIVNLEVSQLPQNQFGYFLTGQSQGFNPNPGGSQGIICLSGNIGRYNQQIGNTGASGSFGILIDLTSMPVNPPQAVLAGETWSFQCWYRDLNPGSTSNFSNAVQVTFN